MRLVDKGYNESNNNRKRGMYMRKPSALLAWKMLILALPKGIGAFVIIVVGISVSLPLSILLIGLPLLAGTLVLSRQMMVGEARFVEGWLEGKEYPAAPASDESYTMGQGWKSWLMSVLKDGRSYRSILFGFLQLPIGIAAFTFAIVLPAVAFSVLLSPLAQELSMRWFEFNLFADTWGLDRVTNWELTSAHRSWIAGGVGAVLTLLLPLMLRGLGRWYGAWIQAVTGPERVQPTEPEAMSMYTDEISPFSLEQAEVLPFQSKRA